MTQSPEKWQKEFRDQFDPRRADGTVVTSLDKIESFISSLLTNQKRGILEEAAKEAEKFKVNGELIALAIRSLHPNK